MYFSSGKWEKINYQAELSFLLILANIRGRKLKAKGGLGGDGFFFYN